MAAHILTQNRLKELLHYNPDTGIFTRNGNITGSTKSTGYIQIGVQYKNHLGHRLAWLYMTGSWPKNCIDHINGIKTDNRWCNLREATYSQNNTSKPLSKNNTSGRKGVTWDKHKNKWKASIESNNRCKHLGHYFTVDEAGDAYELYAKSLHGEFYRAA